MTSNIAKVIGTEASKFQCQIKAAKESGKARTTTETEMRVQKRCHPLRMVFSWEHNQTKGSVVGRMDLTGFSGGATHHSKAKVMR